MSLVTEEFRQQSRVVAETFPEKTDVYYMFVDRVLEDVVSFMHRMLQRGCALTLPRYQTT